MHLDEIPEEEYRQFIQSKFTAGLKVINDEAVLEILRITKRHTYYVQFLCNKLFGSGMQSIDRESVMHTMSDIFKENEVYYGEYRELLTKQQWSLLIAIAKEEGVSKVTSGSFIKKHDLSNNATVRRGIQSLLDKKIIIKKDTGFFVQDVFLAKWLQGL